MLTKINPKSLQSLQTKALRLLVDISNSDVERTPDMRRLLIDTVREILEYPFKGDSHSFLSKILSAFQESPSNLEILELISLFLADCEKKKSIGINFFSKEFGYLEQLDLFQLFYNFLHRMGPRLTQNAPLLDRFFDTLGNLILKQKRPDRLNRDYFLKMWRFVCGNNFSILKDKFSSFVVANYTRYIHRFAIFPALFSNSSIEQLLKLKKYYLTLPGGTPSEQDMRASFKSGKALVTGPLHESQTEAEVTLGTEEQLLFKMLFLIENSVGSKPQLRLLSATLSDELFVTLGPLMDCKGYVELWYIVNFLPRTDILQEFLIKLFRFHDPNYALFFLESSNLSVSKLDERKLSGKKKTLVKKYRISERKSRSREENSDKSPTKLIEKQRFDLCVQVIKNLKSAIEYDNQSIIGNMLDLLYRFLFTGSGFLGQVNCDSHGRRLLDEKM